MNIMYMIITSEYKNQNSEYTKPILTAPLRFVFALVIAHTDADCSDQLSILKRPP